MANPGLIIKCEFLRGCWVQLMKAVRVDTVAKILLVEDDQDIADNAMLFLKHRKHNVLHVTSGLDGLEQLRYGKFDLAILDGNLPDMDGLDVCKTFREEGGTTPILMATGRSDSSEIQKGKDAGVNAYIIKPYSLADLEQNVGALVPAAP